MLVADGRCPQVAASDLVPPIGAGSPSSPPCATANRHRWAALRTAIRAGPLGGNERGRPERSLRPPMLFLTEARGSVDDGHLEIPANAARGEPQIVDPG